MKRRSAEAGACKSHHYKGETACSAAASIGPLDRRWGRHSVEMPERTTRRRAAPHLITCMHISLLWLLLALSWGQDRAPAQLAAASSASGQSKSQHERKATSNDRLFFTLPNFLTLENAGDAPPLTAAQKFKVTARGTFDPVEFLWYGAQAGISQAEDHDAVYGQGAEGYARRFGVRFADGTVENFFTRAIIPSLLREDPRYFQSGKGGFWHRAAYAVSRIFVTRTDSGRSEFNFSEIVGSATAAGISTYTYHPEYARNVSSALDVWGTQVGYDTLSYAVKEFWPDIRRKLRKSKLPGSQPRN